MDDAIIPTAGKVLAGGLLAVTIASLGWFVVQGDAEPTTPAVAMPLPAVQPTVVQATEGLEVSPAPLAATSTPGGRTEAERR